MYVVMSGQSRRPWPGCWTVCHCQGTHHVTRRPSWTWALIGCDSDIYSRIHYAWLSVPAWMRSVGDEMHRQTWTLSTSATRCGYEGHWRVDWVLLWIYPTWNMILCEVPCSTIRSWIPWVNSAHFFILSTISERLLITDNSSSTRGRRESGRRGPSSKLKTSSFSICTISLCYLGLVIEYSYLGTFRFPIFDAIWKPL